MSRKIKARLRAQYAIALAAKQRHVVIKWASFGGATRDGHIYPDSTEMRIPLSKPRKGHVKAKRRRKNDLKFVFADVDESRNISEVLNEWYERVSTVEQSLIWQSMGCQTNFINPEHVHCAYSSFEDIPNMTGDEIEAAKDSLVLTSDNTITTLEDYAKGESHE